MLYKNKPHVHLKLPRQTLLKHILTLNAVKAQYIEQFSPTRKIKKELRFFHLNFLYECTLTLEYHVHFTAANTILHPIDYDY